MDTLPGHKILQFHLDTLENVRKDLGLDKPGQMDAAIDLLGDWVKKQAHFTKKDFPREYLERTIIFAKGSIERAKLQMDKLFTMKKCVPYFFDKVDAKNDFEDIHNYFVDALLPEMTNDHYRIYAAKIIKDGLTARLLRLIYARECMVFEQVRAHDYCSGFVVVIDFRNINLMDLIAQMNIQEMTQFTLFLTEGYQLRMKSIHLLTTSKAIDIFVRLLKQMFSKKIGDRIRVHLTLDTLHECVPQNLLPSEFGGSLQSLSDLNSDWIDVFSAKENIEYMKEMNNATVNENLRIGNRNTIDDMLGIAGSFKSLCVD